MNRFRDTPKAQVMLVLWAAVAIPSLARGFMTSFKPGQSQDFGTVGIWLSTWLWQGRSPYNLPTELTANYPPHAIAFLSPLALIPEGGATLFWSTLNLALAPIAAVLAFRIIEPGAPKRTALFGCILFLSWAGLRIGVGNGQFSLLTLTFGLLAVRITDKRLFSGGVLLALSLMKPHVGVVFLLWTIFTKRLKATAAAMVVILLGLLVFSLRVGQNPVTAATDFVSVLRLQFGGATYLGGAFELRPLIHSIIPLFFAGEIAHLIVLLGLLVIIALVGWKRSALDPQQRDVMVLQLSCLWGLTAVFHNSYDSIMMLPVMVGLSLFALPHPLACHQRDDKLALWFLQFALVLEIPGLWWKLSKRLDLSAYNGAGQLISHFDRLLVIIFFVYLVNRVRPSLSMTMRPRPNRD